MIRVFVFLCLSLVFAQTSFSQRKDSSIFSLPIQMDEFVLKASRTGFDVEGFIRRVKTDTTFYKAFKTLRIVPYTSLNDIKIVGKNNEVIASLYSRTKQNIDKGCRSMEAIEEKTTGKFYDRKGNYNYYTAELYAYLFFTPNPVCGENNIVAGTENERGQGQLEKRKWQLKQLIFNPGSKVAGVPFSGQKAAIFEPEIAKMYNFKLLSVEYEGEDCFLFSAIPKSEYKREIIYNELSTWFRKSDYSIVARDYSLSYKTLVYDFDVRMKVRLKEVNGKLVPSNIVYNGNWHVFSKKRERAIFNTTLLY